MISLQPVLILAVIFLGIIGIIKTATDFQLKQKIIKSGQVDPKSFKVLEKFPKDNKFSALKWGLIAFFAGLGLVALEFIDYAPNSPFPYGVVMVCVSFGFLFYYALVKNEINKKQDTDTEDQS